VFPYNDGTATGNAPVKMRRVPTTQRHRVRHFSRSHSTVFLGVFVLVPLAVVVFQFLILLHRSRSKLVFSNSVNWSNQPEKSTYLEKQPVYNPAELELYMLQNQEALEFNVPFRGFDPLSGRGYSYYYMSYGIDGKLRKHFNITSGCNVWLDKDNSMFDKANVFKQELMEYKNKVRKFTPILDIRTLLAEDESNRDEVCQQIELDPVNGLVGGIFKGSKQLSRTHSVGYVEPLVAPMRHPQFCNNATFMLDLHYLVHDFGHMCRQLKRTSRIVLVDMGASLTFHHEYDIDSPALYLASLYRKFGFPFDHIYAYEAKQQDPKLIFSLVPDDMQAAFHWINDAVSPDENSTKNPFSMLINNFNRDDVIVVKLDIDNSRVEMAFAKQLLNDPRLHGLIDHFYFEHHVFMRELESNWQRTMLGTIGESLELFFNLRAKGVAAHFWV
jgi:hypothetical protein